MRLVVQHGKRLPFRPNSMTKRFHNMAKASALVFLQDRRDLWSQISKTNFRKQTFSIWGGGIFPLNKQILEANLLHQEPMNSSLSQNLSSPTRTTKMMMNKYGESYFNNALLRRVDTSSPESPILVHPKASPGDVGAATITIGEEFSILGAEDDEDENNAVNILSPAEHTDVDVQQEHQAELEQNVDSNILKIHRPKPSLAKTLINYNPAPNISVTGADSLRASNSSTLSTGRDMNITSQTENNEDGGKSNDKCGHDLPTSSSLTDSTNFLEQSPPYLASPIFSHKNSEDGETINYSGTKNSSHNDDADDVCRYNDSNMEFVMDGEHDCSSGSEKFEKQLMESSPPKPLPDVEKNSIFDQIHNVCPGEGGGHNVAPSACNSSSANRPTVSTIGGTTSSSCGQHRTAASAAAAHGAGTAGSSTIKNNSSCNNVNLPFTHSAPPENPPPPPPLELLRDRINQEDEYPPVVIGEFYDHRGSCGDSAGLHGALFNELSYRTPKNNKTVRKVCDKPPSPPQSLKIMSQRKAKQTV